MGAPLLAGRIGRSEGTVSRTGVPGPQGGVSGWLGLLLSLRCVLPKDLPGEWAGTRARHSYAGQRQHMQTQGKCRSWQQGWGRAGVGGQRGGVQDAGLLEGAYTGSLTVSCMHTRMCVWQGVEQCSWRRVCAGAGNSEALSFWKWNPTK